MKPLRTRIILLLILLLLLLLMLPLAAAPLPAGTTVAGKLRLVDDPTTFAPP